MFFIWFCCFNGLFVHVFASFNDEHHQTVTIASVCSADWRALRPGHIQATTRKKSTTAMDTARCRNLSIGFTYHNEATFFIIYLDTLRHAATSQKIFALFDFFCGSWYPSFLQISASSLLQPTRLRTWSTMVQKTKFVREENTLIGDFMAIASPSPLFRWLKCDLPGTYLSSCQSKKVERRHCAF